MGSRRFVVQQHAARARHYDFRLEWDGVLKSWAVPKGPSPNPRDKRLAVHVEDHPVEYAGFEGHIPQGNYGAGAVIVWDRGQWVPLNDPSRGLVDGKLLFELKGYKLRGKWTLVKTRRGEKDWLLIKERDQYGSEKGTEEYPPDSILSGRTLDELREEVDLAAPLERRVARLGAKRRTLDPHKLRPMLAVPGKPFSDPKWVFELKYDGYRLLASKSNGKVSLYSRAGHDLTQTFPEIAEVIGALPFERFVIDGEVIVNDERGLPSFARLQKRGRLTRRSDVERAAVELPATFYAFDVLAFGDYDLRPLTLLERKAVLKDMLPSIGPLRFSEHVAEHGERMYEGIIELGLEGMIAKRGDSPYVSRRSTSWVKVNAEKSDDFAVVGYTAPGGTQSGFGALLLAQQAEGELRYAGRVGTGFDRRARSAITEALEKAPPGVPPSHAVQEQDTTWIEPSLVVEVKFKERTEQGLLRQPVFVRLRGDKAPDECVWNAPLPEEPPVAPPTDPPPVREVQLTNLDKVFWPQDGYTKGDLIGYYRRVAQWLLPYLRDRPLVLTRYPDGIEGKSFFQKDAPSYVPEWLRLETMWSEQAEREIRYFVIENEEGLAYVANMGAIPLHVWSSRVSSLERPDWSILDLDPKGAPFGQVVEIARYLHGLCERIGLPAFVKTSGSTGLHVLIPLGARHTYEQSRILAELLARVTVRALPDIATVSRAVRARQGKVYIDFLQNGHGRLLVAPFSVRPLPRAPVSMPLPWRKVSKRLRIEQFNIETAPKIIAREGDPLAAVLTESADLAAAIAELDRQLDRSA